MTKFKVGDNVNCLAYGKGKIGHIILEEHYKYGLNEDRPILVSFEGQIDIRQYTIDGRLSPKGNITLTTGQWYVKEVHICPECGSNKVTDFKQFKKCEDCYNGF